MGRFFLRFLTNILFCLTFQIIESPGLVDSSILGEQNRVYALLSILINFAIRV